MTIIMHGRAVEYFSAISLNERIKYIKLLFRWQGSVWSLLWADFLWFLLMYIGVTLLYRLYLIHDVDHKRRFETIVSYMNKVGALVPLSFLLGFFVSTILGRWWDVITSIPWMTKPSFACQALITGGNKKTCRTIRTTFVRYLNLAWILSLIQLSQKVKHRFYIEYFDKKKSIIRKKQKRLLNITVRERLEKINADDVVQKCFGKIVTEEEIMVFENFEKSSVGPYKPPYIIPLMWATKLLEKSFKEGYIVSEKMYLILFNIVMDFRGGLGTLSMFNEFNVPLVYTQVVIIVVYTFLVSEIFSQQMIILDAMPQQRFVYNSTRLMANFNNLNWQEVFPIFTIFKFLIYMGWFKIGLSLINPLGREKTDIPLDTILDYNLEISATVAPAEDFYYPEYLSDKTNRSDKDRLDYLKKFHHTPSSMVKLYDVVDSETVEIVRLPGGGDDKEPQTFEIA